jgi:hypothetical protein
MSSGSDESVRKRTRFLKPTDTREYRSVNRTRNRRVEANKVLELARTWKADRARAAGVTFVDGERVT